MTDLQRLRTVTKGYPYLQGLKVVPIGLFILLVAARGSTLLMAIGAIATLAAVAWIGQYYNRRFGRVAPTRTQLRRDAIGTIAAGVALGLALLLDNLWGLQVSLFGLTLAVVLLWYWSWSGGPRTYHWVLAAALALVSLLPLVGEWLDLDLIETGEPALSLVLATTGAVYVAAGLLDHRYLVHSMGPATGGNDVDPA